MSKPEWLMTKPRHNRCNVRFRHSCFFIVSPFDIRHSSLSGASISLMKTSACLCAFLFACNLLLAEDKVAEKLKPALDVITPDALLSHIKILASDEFEGRAPGSKGEE